MRKKYDFLIVGAGLFGSVFAYEATKRGKKCLIIEKRNHVGGNVYCENIEGINVHKYGAHIFHTNNKYLWDYVNQFAKFNGYIHSPIANFKGEIYNLPFNMNTFNKLWGVITPAEAKVIIEEQKKKISISKPKNLEEQAIFLVGTDIYEKLIKGYTEKQWGKSAKELPPFIINRLPVRMTYDNNYFNDKYQGIPEGGYNQIFDKLLNRVDVILNVDYFEHKNELQSIANRIVFTGMIDEFYDYCFGKLEYRSLRFENEILDIDNYQGSAVVNYTDSETPYTRIIEHKHFEFGTQKKTVITREYPCSFNKTNEPYYPVNDNKNNKVYKRYKQISQKEDKIIFGGRLGNYKYYDMDDVIYNALKLVKNIL